eukprot:4397765-Pleurochrysis_carterae.AAC.1
MHDCVNALVRASTGESDRIFVQHVRTRRVRARARTACKLAWMIPHVKRHAHSRHASSLGTLSHSDTYSGTSGCE